MLVALLAAAISMGIVYLYGSIGETIIEKGGNLNLGIPGIMCLGALGGVIGVNLYISMFGVEAIMAWLIILFAIFFAHGRASYSPMGSQSGLKPALMEKRVSFGKVSNF